MRNFVPYKGYMPPHIAIFFTPTSTPTSTHTLTLTMRTPTYGKTSTDITARVANFIGRHHLLSPGAKVIVGLSGGPDSVCLTLMLHEMGYDLTGVHCNFHLRGEESMRDERFVRDLCQKLNIPLHKADFDTAQYAKDHKLSIEMAARELRYDLFRRLKAELHAEAIAVGHHQDDNVETLMLNMVRGTGLKGACGMQAVNGDIIRPLLCLRRHEILDFLAARQQDYVTDHTNLEDEYARNKVRLNIVPQMEAINPRAVDNISTTMDNLREVYNIYIWWMEQVHQRCCSLLPTGDMRIDIPQLLSLPSPQSALHELLSPACLSRADITSLLDICLQTAQPTSSPTLPHPCESNSRTLSGKVFGKEGRRVIVDRDCLLLEAEHYTQPTISHTVHPISEVHIEKAPHLAYLDADKLSGPLTVRTPMPGDTFAPFGMGGRRKLLSDYMTDQKMNLFDKERQLLLVDGNEIAWVVGRRGSEKYRVDKNTKRVVVASCQ